jgi:hypothetical protein
VREASACKSAKRSAQIALGVVLTDGILVGIGYFIGLSGILLVTLIVIFGKALLVFIINFAKYLSY